jgi:tetratricopeptide (TPR) repeat protein
MPFVRRRGNQLVLAHAEREPGTGKVQQRILFTLYSRPEALEAVGKGSQEGRHTFRYLLADAFPKLRFDWKAIDRAILDNLDALPESYEYRTTRLLSRFRMDLCAFARQLVLADPNSLLSAAATLDAHRRELEYVRELIDLRLRTPTPKPARYNEDNPWFWRTAFRGREVPADIEERAADHYEKREFEKAEVIFGILVEAFEDYAEGHNYLGLIALDRGWLPEAIERFRKTIELGRRLFPKRVAKSSWWTDLSTRPYLRGLKNLALALGQAGEEQEAFAICDRLERECDDPSSANALRAPVYLNTGRWAEAATAALYNRNLDPSESLLAALAQYEAGDSRAAVVSLLHGALNSPRAARMILCPSRRAALPRGYLETRDHNGGVHLVRSLRPFLARRRRASLVQLGRLLEDPLVSALMEEMEAVSRRWSAAGPKAERADFLRMTEMGTLEFAEAQARRVVERTAADPRRRLH